MTYDECYVWLSARIHRAIERDRERMVQRLVDNGLAKWMPRRRIASCYRGGATRRYAKAVPPCPRCANRGGDPEHEGKCGECGKERA